MASRSCEPVLGSPTFELVIRIVHGLADPQPMEHDGELPGDGDHGALLRILPPALRDRLSVPSQIALWPERSEDILRGTDQEATAEFVAGLRDAKLWCRHATFIETRHQPEVRAHVATL